jgi:8-oxo-dGTP pyrophosphatase MutT (NUDIX family)
MRIPDFELCEIKDHDGWHQLPGCRVYEGPYVQVEECSFLTPSRPDQPVPWTVAYRKSAVAVAPMTEDGRFILIHQERLPVRRALWEFPAGQIDEEHSHATIVDTVLRELDEEAGCEVSPEGELIPLGWFFGSQGFTSEHVYLFVARPVHIVREPQPVGGEHIGEVRLVTPEELGRMVRENIIQDALTLALYARMAARGLLQIKGAD